MGTNRTKSIIFILKDGENFKVLRNVEWVKYIDLYLEFLFKVWIDFECIAEEEMEENL